MSNNGDNWKAAFPKPDWEADDVLLYCGDCLDILPKLPAGCVDAVVTDPPYGIGGDSGKVQMRGNHIVSPDYGSWDDAVDFRWLEVTPVGGSLIAFHDQKQSTRVVELAAQRGWRLRHFVFWDKGDGGLNPRRNFVNRVEVAAFLTNGTYTWNGGGSTENIKRIQSRPTPYHPTQKPLELFRWLVGLISNAGGLVVDPFMGSGTTGVACIQTGRRFVGIEIDAGYFDIAVRRIKAAIRDDASKFAFAQAKAPDPQMELIRNDD